jgi:hypothetical protein
MGLFMPVLTFENISSKTKQQANFIDYLSQQCPSNQHSNHLSLVICDLFSNLPKASLQTFKQAKQTVIINTKDHAIDLRLQLQDKKKEILTLKLITSPLDQSHFNYLMNTYSLPITQIDNQAVAQILSKTIIKTFDFHIEHTQLLPLAYFTSFIPSYQLFQHNSTQFTLPSTLNITGHFKENILQVSALLNINDLAQLQFNLVAHTANPIWLLPLVQTTLGGNDTQPASSNKLYLQQAQVTFTNYYLLQYLIKHMTQKSDPVTVMVAQEQMSQILLKSAKKQRNSTTKKFLITLSDFMQKPYQLNINLHKINSTAKLPTLWQYIWAYLVLQAKLTQINQQIKNTQSSSMQSQFFDLQRQKLKQKKAIQHIISHNFTLNIELNE